MKDDGFEVFKDKVLVVKGYVIGCYGGLYFVGKCWYGFVVCFFGGLFYLGEDDCFVVFEFYSCGKGCGFIWWDIYVLVFMDCVGVMFDEEFGYVIGDFDVIFFVCSGDWNDKFVDIIYGIFLRFFRSLD